MTWTTRLRSDLGNGLSGIVSGSGPTVLLIHGVGLRAEAWAPQIDTLSRCFRVVAVDLPGHGESALNGAGTLAGFADLVARGLTGTAVVAGHSLGAMIAAELAREMPDRVRGLACLNAIHRRGPAARAAVAARAAELDGKAAADPEPTLARWFGEGDSAARRACRAWLTGVDPAGYRAAYRVFASGDGPSDAALGALGCPALFTTGGREPNSTPAMSRAMAALAPNGRAVILPDAAHMMPMTHAGDVSDILGSFAKECQDDTP